VRIALPDEVGILVTNGLEALVDLATSALRTDDTGEFFLAGWTHPQPYPIIGQHLHLVDVISDAPGHGRVHTTGVVAQHTAKGTPAMRGGIRSKREVVFLLQGLAQMVVDHARLHTRPFPCHVDVQDLVDMLGKIDHDSDITTLAGQTSATAS
jgi:hypothetical protein